MARSYETPDEHEPPWPRTRVRRQRPTDAPPKPHRSPKRSKQEQAAGEPTADPLSVDEDEPSAPIATPELELEFVEDEELESSPPGFRPPRNEEVCLPPLDGDWYKTVSDATSMEDPAEIWLYASGGGFRSPQAALGVAWYLGHVDHWKYVTRVVSVSGGALANAEFAARAQRGATDRRSRRPLSFVADFHRRLSTPHRWVLALLVVVMLVVATATLYLMWQSNEISIWLVGFRFVRWGLAVIAVAALLLLIWEWSKPSLTRFVLHLAGLAVGVGLAWFVIRAWSSSPSWLQWAIALTGVVALVWLLWVLTGRETGKWLAVVVVAAIGAALVWYLLWNRGARHDGRWLEVIMAVALVTLELVAYIAVLQLGIFLMMRFRIGRLLRQSGTPQPTHLDDIKSGLAHVFSTADYRSGHPTYLSAGPLVAGGTGGVAIHDVSTSANAVHCYNASSVRIRDAVYHSAALPGLVWLRSTTLVAAFAAGNEPRLVPSPGIWSFGIAQVAPPVPNGIAVPQPQPRDRRFTLMDGGLNSTLGTRLDPLLAGFIDDRGTMGVIEMLYPPATPNSPVANHKVRRVVVDAGQYLDDRVRTRVSTLLGVSAVFTLVRGLTISNLSLLESDRLLADRMGTDIWYLPTTGGHRTFALRFSAAASNALAAAGIAHASPDPLRDLVLIPGQLAWFNGTVASPLDKIAQSIDRVLLLKQRSDKVSLVSGQAAYGYDALASGVASAYVEHKGIDADPVELEATLCRLDETLLDGAQNPIRFGQSLPLAISHQGLRDPGVRGNSAHAFVKARQAGFTMLEVDVMRTRDRELMAQHPGDVEGRPVGKELEVTAKGARQRPFAHWQAKIDDPNDRTTNLVTLRQLLDPSTHANVLFPNDTLAVVECKVQLLESAIWNVEAKDRRSAIAVADLLKELAAKRANLPDIVFSGGWLLWPLWAFRRRSNAMTACHWVDALRLALGFGAARPALIQVPVVTPDAWWARPFVIRLLQRAVRQGRAEGKAILWFPVDHRDEAILLRSLVPCHGFMTEGTDVLDWSKVHW